jgi:23S rRNA pseudouridine1911/1915/1917 synthase
VTSDKTYFFEWPATACVERLDRALVRLLPDWSRTHVQRHIKAGLVCVNDRIIQEFSHKVLAGDQVSVTEMAIEPLSLEPINLNLDIRYEDDHILVLNKPAGLIVHPGAGTKAEATLIHGLLSHCKGRLSGIGGVERPGIVHRLDKDTSGLMVVAKSDHAHQGLVAQFQTKILKRVYTAFVYGCPMPCKGVIHGNIGRDMKNRKKMQLLPVGGKEAVTHYEVKADYWVEGREILASQVECRLETGRTHQIRVHMFSRGHGLLGDTTYQSRSHKRAILKRLLAETPSFDWKEGRQALHAHSLKFEHPITQQTLGFKSDLPKDLQELQKFLEHINTVID